MAFLLSPHVIVRGWYLAIVSSLSEKVFLNRTIRFRTFSFPYSYTYSYTPISFPLFLSRIREICVYEYVYEYVFPSTFPGFWHSDPFRIGSSYLNPIPSRRYPSSSSPGSVSGLSSSCRSSRRRARRERISAAGMLRTMPGRTSSFTLPTGSIWTRTPV
jgi:hypothetical protein